jgi:hypothetical protein
VAADLRLSLIYRALVALDHEIETAGAEPSAPSPAVRFALAFLYLARDGQERRPFDSFWKEMIAVDRSQWDDNHKRSMRCTLLRGSLTGIVRSLGLPITPGIFLCISRGQRAGCVRQAHVESFWTEIQNYHCRGMPARARARAKGPPE